MPAPSPVIQKPRPLSIASAGRLASSEHATTASAASPTIVPTRVPTIARRMSLANCRRERFVAFSYLVDKATPAPNLVADPEAQTAAACALDSRGSGR
jgi:hypothetical protein